MLIVAVTVVEMYRTYTEDKRMQEAIQMAKDENRQLEINTHNNFQIIINVSNGGTIAIAGGRNSVSSVIVYPRNYCKEIVVKPDGSTITPYAANHKIY